MTSTGCWQRRLHTFLKYLSSTCSSTHSPCRKRSRLTLFWPVLGSAVRIGALEFSDSVASCPAQQPGHPQALAQRLGTYAAKMLPPSRSAPLEFGSFYISKRRSLGAPPSSSNRGAIGGPPSPRPSEGLGGPKRPRSWGPEDGQTSQQHQALLHGHRPTGKSQARPPSGARFFPCPRCL
jgi:hypothetical protein